MAEQQLVDYIKKARQAGQPDDQTRGLLYKNDWTEAEVSGAFMSLEQAQAQPQDQVRPQPQPAKPEPQYQSMVGVSQGSEPRTRGRLHFIFTFLIILIILIVLVVVGSFAAGQYINLPWNPFWPNPKTVIANMLENMKGVKSSQTKIELWVDVANNNKSHIFQLSLNMQGGSDAIDPNNVKARFALATNLTQSGSASNPNSFSANLDMIVLGNNSYFKVNSLSIPSSSPYFGLDTSQIKAKWLKLDQNSINALSQAGVGSFAPMINVSQIINPLPTEDLFSNYKQLGDQTVNAKSTYHYLVTISKDKLKDLLNKLIPADFDFLVQSFAGAFADAMGDTNIEMWIGKKDYMLYGIKFDKAIDFNKIYQGLNINLAINLTMTNSDFDKPVAVQSPDASQKIEGVLSPLLKAQAIIQNIKSYLTQIGYYAGRLFSVENSYSSLCYKGLLNGYAKTYGSNLITLNNLIIKNSGKRPVCFSGIQDFCASTQLPNGSYLCIGKNNAVGAVKCASSQTLCE